MSQPTEIFTLSGVYILALLNRITVNLFAKDSLTQTSLNIKQHLGACLKKSREKRRSDNSQRSLR